MLAQRLDEAAQRRRRLALRHMQRLGGDHGEPGEGGIEASPGACLLGPGEEDRRGHIVLAGAGGFAAGNEGALGGGLGLLEIAGHRHGDIADIAMAIGIAGLAPDQQQIGQQRDAADEQLGAMPVGQQAEIGPDGGQIVEGGRRHGIVIAAGADAAAIGMARIRRDIDRIVGDRGQRNRRRPLGLGQRAMGMAQHPRQDAIADGGLVIAPPAAGPGRDIRAGPGGRRPHAHRPRAPPAPHRNAPAARGRPRWKARRPDGRARRRRRAASAASPSSAAAAGEPLISEPRSLTSRSKRVASSANSG